MPHARSVLFVLALASMAHVGSPDTFFTGHAGMYPIRVTVRLPGVIPGLATITVRIPQTQPDAIRRVTVRAIQWNVGPEGAPPADVAARVPGDAELYSAELWFMAPTSYRVHVTVEGTDGRGTAVVPVLALATEQREMSSGMSLLLSALGLFLAAGLVTIVGAAVREAVVPPGSAPDATRRRRARIAIAIAAVVLIGAATGGHAWWNAEASSYGEFVLYRPFNSEAAVTDRGGHRALTLTIRDDRWPPRPGLTRYNALMPDHGKLMHMFLVREPALDAFAHVHPVPETPSAERFVVPVPPLPAGKYRVYGDIVHESGYAQTLVATADMPASGVAASSADPDDSWFLGAAVSEGTAAPFRAADGTQIVWLRGQEPLVEGAERLLTFAARGSDGAPVALEPYMGMFGHVAVTREDGAVFAHLHPSGSISMAALQKFAGSDPHALHRAPATSEVTVPYAFPKAGRYRVWVQIKLAGRVVTGAFDAQVAAANVAEKRRGENP